MSSAPVTFLTVASIFFTDTAVDAEQLLAEVDGELLFLVHVLVSGRQTSLTKARKFCP